MYTKPIQVARVTDDFTIYMDMTLMKQGVCMCVYTHMYLYAHTYVHMCIRTLQVSVPGALCNSATLRCYHMSPHTQANGNRNTSHLVASVHTV